MRTGIPSVEAADDTHRASIRSPHGEACTRLIAQSGKVRSELFIGAIVAAFIEQIEILFGKKTDVGTRTRSQGGLFHTIAPTVSVPEAMMRSAPPGNFDIGRAGTYYWEFPNSQNA